jgi:hypothetical protein
MGTAYEIRKLSPSDFIQDDNFGLNNVIEKVNKTGNALETQDEVDKVKSLMQKVIEKSLIKVSKWFKSFDRDFAIRTLMQNPEMYSYLFSEIIRLSFGIKKKTKHLFI